MRRLCIFLAALTIFFTAACISKSKDISKSKSESKAKEKDIVVKNGRDIAFHYTLTVEGEVIESSQGGPPLQYTHGKPQIIIGLSKQLEGLHVGDKRSITVSPEEGYGTLNPNAIKEVARSSLPANVDLKVGAFVQVRASDGRNYRAKIVEVKKGTVVFDFNHPLAGKTLNFDVEIVSIN